MRGERENVSEGEREREREGESKGVTQWEVICERE